MEFADPGVLEAWRIGLGLSDLGSDPSLPIGFLLFFILLLRFECLEFIEFEECFLSFETLEGIR